MTTVATRRPLRFLDALPSYLGGKRRLLGQIAKMLPLPCEAHVLLDPFLGGGSVSLWAKRRGYRVIANDIAARSAVVGRALVENDRVRLTREDLTRVFATDQREERGFVERSFAGDVIPVRHARFVDRLLHQARSIGGTKCALLELLAMRHVVSLRPLGNFGARLVMEQMARGEWEDVNPSVLRDSFTGRVQAHPVVLAEELRQRINRGVFSNGQVNEVHQGDVFKFLAGVEGHVVYLDPPYGGTQSYESALRPLDSILAGRLVESAPSTFSGRQAPKMLDDLVAACRRVPRLVLSYGNAALAPDAIEALVRRHRHDVRMETVAYAHLAAIANADTKERNVEILISAGGPR